MPRRAVEDVAFAVARFYAKGGALMSYYMVRRFVLQAHHVLLSAHWVVLVAFLSQRKRQKKSTSNSVRFTFFVRSFSGEEQTCSACSLSCQ
jgi:hypothetical protein